MRFARCHVQQKKRALFIVLEKKKSLVECFCLRREDYVIIKYNLRGYFSHGVLFLCEFFDNHAGLE